MESPVAFQGEALRSLMNNAEVERCEYYSRDADYLVGQARCSLSRMNSIMQLAAALLSSDRAGQQSRRQGNSSSSASSLPEHLHGGFLHGGDASIACDWVSEDAILEDSSNLLELRRHQRRLRSNELPRPVDEDQSLEAAFPEQSQFHSEPVLSDHMRRALHREKRREPTAPSASPSIPEQTQEDESQSVPSSPKRDSERSRPAETTANGEFEIDIRPPPPAVLTSIPKALPPGVPEVPPEVNGDESPTSPIPPASTKKKASSKPMKIKTGLASALVARAVKSCRKGGTVAADQAAPDLKPNPAKERSGSQDLRREMMRDMLFPSQESNEDVNRMSSGSTPSTATGSQVNWSSCPSPAQYATPPGGRVFPPEAIAEAAASAAKAALAAVAPIKVEADSLLLPLRSGSSFGLAAKDVAYVPHPVRGPNCTSSSTGPACPLDTLGRRASCSFEKVPFDTDLAPDALFSLRSAPSCFGHFPGGPLHVDFQDEYGMPFPATAAAAPSMSGPSMPSGQPLPAGLSGQAGIDFNSALLSSIMKQLPQGGLPEQPDTQTGQPEAPETMPDGSPWPSEGSKVHFMKECKPCLFWYNGICLKQKRCPFCHIPHDMDEVRKVRPYKATRKLIRRSNARHKQQEKTSE